MTTLTGVGINVSLVELISANVVYEVSHLGARRRDMGDKRFMHGIFGEQTKLSQTSGTIKNKVENGNRSLRL